MANFASTKRCIFILFVFWVKQSHCMDGDGPGNGLENVNRPLKPGDFGVTNALKSVIGTDSARSRGTYTNFSGISENVAQIVSLCCFIFLSSCILQFIVSKINEKIPISIVCFVFGMLTYTVSIVFENGKGTDPLTSSISGLRKIDNSILYYISLPILLYEATQDINWYAFCNFIVGGVSLAIIGVIFQVIILGVLFHYVLDISAGQSIIISFLLASTLSSTDPVAVLSVLSGVQAPPKLSSIFNGESLINDGSSVLLFQFFYLLSAGEPQSYWYYGLLFFKLLFLGPLLGLIVGIVVTMWISLFRRYHASQCLAVMATGYLVYFLAEYTMNMSGPLAIVCYGVFIKGYGLVAFDREALEKHHHFLEGVCLIANSSVFMISGVLTVGMLRSQFVGPQVWLQLCKLLTVYFFLNVVRALMIVIFCPLLSYIGYGLNFKEAFLLIWGGLRGAIVLVLGLRLESDPNIESSISDVLAFYISGSVMLILILQGFTFELFYRLLNPYPMKPFRRVYLVKVMNMIDYNYLSEIRWLEQHWLFKGTNVINYANKLVPSMSTIKWNKTGNLAFDMPNIDEVLEKLSDSSLIEPSEHCSRQTSSGVLNLPIRCNTVVSCSEISLDSCCEGRASELHYDPENSLKGEDGAESSADGDSDIPLLTYGMMQKNKSTGSVRYDPKMYLRLLEHALTAEFSAEDPSSSSQIPAGEQIKSLEEIVISHYQRHESMQTRSFSQVESRPQRTDTDTTINLENLYLKSLHMRKGRGASVMSYGDSDILYQLSGIGENDGANCNRALREEREGELYIMIFNAFSDMYSKLYKSALIDGGSLLALQTALDIAADFALKKLKKRSITAWANVLCDYINDPNTHDYTENVEGMDGFEFEWFVLQSMIDGNTANKNYRFGKQFFKFSQHGHVLSILEMLIAYIDVHQHLLDKGGRNMEKLLGEKLLKSYNKQISLAKGYIQVIKRRWPNDFRYGLINMAACMMIRIKKDIVNEQSAHGLLLDEDRKKIQEILEDQLYRIATSHEKINVFKLFFRKFFNLSRCNRNRCKSSS